MKCPNCGGEIEPGNNFCGSCGSQISLEMKKEQEQLNKAGCPKCGSSNVTFNREKNGEFKGKNGTAIIRSTVGFCKDCGYTWQTTEQKKKRKTWLWVLGWIFIFPLPLTLILLKKKDMKPILKYGIIAIAWILYLLIAFSGRSNPPQEPTVPDSQTISSETDYKTTEQVVEKDVKEETTKELIAETTTKVQETEASTKVQETEDNVPKEYKTALKSANSYSKTMHMSKQGIYDQLTSEYGGQFPAEAAQYAIDNLEADYNENALLQAQSYSKSMHMSKQGIYEQLISEYGGQFTEEEAKYAIDHLVADYNENALAQAKSYQDSLNMSKAAIYDQLISEYGGKFTESEAQYAVDHLE